MLHNYGEVFENVIRSYRPVKVVELGVLDGYSTLYIAKALKYNHERGEGQGHVDSYDLFEEYEFKHGSMEDVAKMLEKEGVSSYVTLQKSDAFKVHTKYADNSVHLLHVDISNTGEILRKIMAFWDPKMVVGGIILFEGGSPERDRIDWMQKYDKEPIKPEMDNNAIIRDNYIFGTYNKYPSLSILLKKRS